MFIISHHSRTLFAVLILASGTVLAQTNVPTLSITSGPEDAARLTNSTVVLGGLASDDSAVVAVEWQMTNSLGATGWQGASGTTNWTITITNLAVGSNTVSVRARDDAINTSAAASRTFVLLTPLIITVTGCGSITPDDLGTTFKEVGLAYTLTAVPCPGHALTNWTGSIQTNTPSLTFIMRTGLVLQANFGPRDYAPIPATYNGLYHDTNSFSPLSSGSLTLRTTAVGHLSGSVLLGKTRYSFTGQFDPSGHAQVVAGNRDVSLNLDLQMDTASGGEWFVGSVTNGNRRAELTAWRAAYDATNSPAPQEGRYTVFLAGNPGSASEPAGDGYGTLLAGKNGRVRAAMVLADGTRITQSTFLGRGGKWPFHAPVYQGAGVVLGWLSLPPLEDKLVGGVRWFKPAQAKSKAYPIGFSITNAALGSRYTAPTGTLDVLNFSDAIVQFYGGNLDPGISNRVVLNNKTRINNLSSNALAMKFSVSSGLFSGRVINRATRRALRFAGAADQARNLACGFFLDAAQSGRVLCEESFSLKGGFVGLFYMTNQVAFENSGSITLTTGRGGSFSGRLQLAGRSYSIHGRFNATGHARFTLKRPGSSPLIVELQFDPGFDGNRLTGTVSDGAWTAQLAADRPVFNGTTRIAPQAGKYTFIVSGADANPALPGGDGYGLATVGKDGDLSLAATLADGTKISQSASVSGNGQWPIFVQLYGRQGSLLGWMSFVTNSATEDLVGELIWIKPVLAGATNYPGGFAWETIASGSRYTRPDAGTRVLSLTNATVTFRGGSLLADITNHVTLDSNNLVLNLDNNLLNLTFSLSSGLFSGAVTVPFTSQQVPFNGVVLQKSTRASGFFLGAGQSGRVSLQGP